MVKDIHHLMSNKKSAIAVMKSNDYNSASMDIVKDLDGGSLCYISLNKTYASLKEAFKKKKINSNNILVIDTISKTMKNTPDESRCFYVSSPSALTELSLAISKFLEYNFDYLIFDSITNLKVYHSKDKVLRFISTVINRIQNTNTKAIFYATNLKDSEGLIKESRIFMDTSFKI